MSRFRTEAIILSKEDFMENDALVAFYSDDMGKVKGVAKGAKKSKRRFGANLDILSHVIIQGSLSRSADLARIDAADLVEAFDHLRGDLVSFARGCYLAEWIEGCTAYGQPISGLLELALMALRSLNQPNAEATIRIVEIKLLDKCGYRPRLASCVRCGARIQPRGEVAFDVDSGGVVCDNCSPGGRHMRVSYGTIQVLREALMIDPCRMHRLAFTARSMEEAKGLSRALYLRHVGRPLRSVRFLEGLEKRSYGLE